MKRRIIFELKSLPLDIAANKGNSRGILFFVIFRLSKVTKYFPFYLDFAFYPIRAFYSVLVRYLLSIDIPLDSHIGHSCKFFHGFGFVLHPNAKIYKGCVLRHGITIGESSIGNPGAPVISTYVDIGCNVVILGNVGVGSKSKIGACSLIVKDVPPNSIVYSNLSRLRNAI
jgi:putative colanic acid biosynthesis acetyltransferase WcaB